MMRRAIERKREGQELAGEKWEAIIEAYVDGRVDDAQMAAMLMACVWRGLSRDECVAMTRAMVASGQTLQFPADEFVVDKHSSGGVSDIVSLVAVPIVAACGVHVAKLSGRALGHTGGTIDKLETIAGFNVALSMDRFVEQVRRVGSAIAAQTQAFVPADKRLYALRDRTGTVPSIGLISASIVSKKIAGGARAFVFDVKCGSAAFMHTVNDAIALAESLVEVARAFGRDARAVVSDMNEPVGTCIGTGIEVIEARDFLREHSYDRRSHELCTHIAQAMLELAGIDDALAAAQRALESGVAYESFVALIEAQGGSRSALEAMTLPQQHSVVTASRDGVVTAIDAVALGNAARELSSHVATGGIKVAVRTGSTVRAGDVLADVYGTHVDAARLAQAFHIGDELQQRRPLIYATI